MLIEFRVRNFRSFRDEQVLSMLASSEKDLEENTISSPELGKHKLLRSAVIYGANASGKSNIIKALLFVVDFIKTSIERSRETNIPVHPFRFDSELEYEPSEFEITFIQKGIRYQYGFAVNQYCIHSEWLIAYPRGLPQVWFRRTLLPETEQFDWYYGSNLKGERRTIEGLTRPDVLFLSVAAAFNHKQLSVVYNWFKSYLRVRDMNEDFTYFEALAAQRLIKDEILLRTVRRMLKVADLGIKDIIIDDNGSPTDHDKESHSAIDTGQVEWGRYSISFEHEVEGSDDASIRLSLDDESYGTRRLLGMLIPWIDTLRTGYTLVVDELDSSLHPHLVRLLIQFFHDPTLSERGAQLIFNTHDTTLLDTSLFRRDQIWFVEKDRSGASHLYPLLEFKPRSSEALARGYLNGRYGAVPFIDKEVTTKAVIGGSTNG